MNDCGCMFVHIININHFYICWGGRGGMLGGGGVLGGGGGQKRSRMYERKCVCL